MAKKAQAQKAPEKPLEQEGQAPAPAEGQGGSDKAKAKKAKFVVVSRFRDRDNFEKFFDEGDDVSHFEEQRLLDAIQRGLVKES